LVQVASSFTSQAGKLRTLRKLQNADAWMAAATGSSASCKVQIKDATVDGMGMEPSNMQLDA
jgi:hypothetical protein